MPHTREPSNRRRGNEEKIKSMTTPFFQTLFMSFGYQSIVHSFRLAVQRNQRRRPGMPGCRVEKRPLWERGETKKKKEKKEEIKKQPWCTQPRVHFCLFLLRRHRSKEDGGGGGAALLFLRVLLHSCPYWSPGAEADESGRVIRTGDGGGSGARTGGVGGCTHSEPVSGALDVEPAPTEITTNTRHGHKATPRRSHSKVLFFSCFSFPFIK